MVDAALRTRGLGLTIGGARILENITLKIPRGEMVGVIGPNGAGKTTLFNLISGVYTPTTGTVELNGEDITRLPIHKRTRRGLGRTFQTSNVFPELDVVENVRLAAQSRLGRALSLVAFPRANDEATEIAWDCLDAVGLADRGGNYAGNLSHGDKRKLEIAVLLAGEAGVVLLDEPMAGLGSADVPEVTEVIRMLSKKHGRTVLMVEHHLDVVLGLVDTVAVLHNGELLAHQSPQEIMANPTVQSAYIGEEL